MQEILSSREIQQKIERIAHQLIENTFNEDHIFVGGIHGNGSVLANSLAEIIRSNSETNVTSFEININKDKPWDDTIEISAKPEELTNSYIVLVDDVINSGKTLQFALVEMLKFPTKAIKTVTLVDRKHRRFPIKANFVGLGLSTTLQDCVEVDLTAGAEKAYLI